MIYLTADYILPSDGRILKDQVLVLQDNGEIETILPRNELASVEGEIQFFKGILCPGFVNAHCHLEFSWAKSLLKQNCGLDSFIRQLQLLRKNISIDKILTAIEKEGKLMAENGIIAIADIANTDASLKYKRNTGTYFHTFVEAFGSNPAGADEIFKQNLAIYTEFKSNPKNNSASIVPHSTYSLSNPLYKLISSFAQKENGIMSIHHQETEAENQLFATGTGTMAERRKLFNQSIPDFKATGKRPMESIAEYFAPLQKILFVHNTFSDQEDIEFIENYFADAYWCFCPNANLFIENRLPDIPLFRKKNCKIALGTDSLASNRQLNLLEEIKIIQSHFPAIPLPEILQWSTLNGADFLGISSKAGSFEKGKNPGVVLIESIDLDSIKVLPESTSRLLIKASL